ncbi:hypothetical protein HDU97_002339 [Phlyctochytrium planicorne]|nr:hypothetical protein HDU97_002339 [Phlyctochytrium planicorne]
MLKRLIVLAVVIVGRVSAGSGPFSVSNAKADAAAPAVVAEVPQPVAQAAAAATCDPSFVDGLLIPQNDRNPLRSVITNLFAQAVQHKVIYPGLPPFIDGTNGISVAEFEDLQFTSGLIPYVLDIGKKAILAEVQFQSLKFNITKLSDYLKLYGNIFAAPGFVSNNDTNFLNDDFFARSRLLFYGSFIRSFKGPRLPFRLQDKEIPGLLPANETLASALSSGKLYVEDHTEVDYIHRHIVAGKFLGFPTVLFYKQENGPLVPLAIKLGHLTITPTDGAIWTFAKIVANSVNSQRSIMGIHFLDHFALLPLTTSYYRTLASNHPVRVILGHILRQNLGVIGFGRRTLLVPESGFIDQVIAAGTEGSLAMMTEIYNTFDFFASDPNAEIKSRDIEGLMSDFPFYSTAKQYHATFTDLMNDLIGAYYTDDAAVSNDAELQAFAKDVSGVAKLKDKPMPIKKDEVTDDNIVSWFPNLHQAIEEIELVARFRRPVPAAENLYRAFEAIPLIGLPGLRSAKTACAFEKYGAALDRIALAVDAVTKDPVQLTDSIANRTPVTAICVSESILYTGDHQGTVTSHNLATLQEITYPRSHTKAITSLFAFNSRLFSAAEDGCLAIWQNSTAVRTIRGHEGSVTAVCVTPEGRVYTGGADRVVNEWDPASGRRLWVLQGHTKRVTALCSSAGRLYSGGNDHTVRVWDMASGRCLFVLEQHTDWILGLCLGRDLLYSASKDGAVKVWDTSSGQCLRTLKGHAGGVKTVCIASGKLYSGGDDKAIIEWDVKSGKPVKKMGGHYAGISSLGAGFDGKLYSGSGDCSVRVWDISSTAPPPPPSSPNIPTNNSNRAPPPPKPFRLSTFFDTLLPSPTTAASPETLLTQTSPPSPTEVINLRSQLEQAQDLLTKQNRLKSKLKADLTTTRAELTSCQDRLNAAAEMEERVRELEAELRAAKELVGAYKKELGVSQEAHISALDYIIRKADEKGMEIELEVVAVRRLLEDPWSPLHSDKQDEFAEEVKKARRVWERDDEWDSDIDVGDELKWWRGESAFKGLELMSPIVETGFDIDAAFERKHAKRRTLILGRGSLPEISIPTPEQQQQEQEQQQEQQSQPQEKSNKRRTIILSKGLDSLPSPSTPTVYSPSPNPQNGELVPASPRWSNSNVDDLGDPATMVEEEDAEVDSIKAWDIPAKPIPWHIPTLPDSPTVRDDDQETATSSGVWSGKVVVKSPVKANGFGAIQSGGGHKWGGWSDEEEEKEKVEEEEEDIDEAGKERSRKIRIRKSMPAISSSSSGSSPSAIKKRQSMYVTSSEPLPEDLSEVLYSGRVTSSPPTSVIPKELDAIVWNGRVRHVGSSESLSRRNSHRKSSPPVEDVPTLLKKVKKERKEARMTGFGDHADVPSSSNVTFQSLFSDPSASPTSSSTGWLSPIKSLVETIGEQLAPPIPPSAMRRVEVRRESLAKDEEEKAKSVAFASESNSSHAGPDVVAQAAGLMDGVLLDAPSKMALPPPPSMLPPTPMEMMGDDKVDPASTLEKMANAFENVIENVIENPWSVVGGWFRSSRKE